MIFSTQLLYIHDESTYTTPLNSMKRPGTQEPEESQLVYNISVWSEIVESSSEVPVKHDTYDSQGDIEAHEKS